MSSASVLSKLFDQEDGDQYFWLAGVDEAGRGAWAGPLCVALVVYPYEAGVKTPQGLIADSKSISPKQREQALKELRGQAVWYGYAWANPDDIGRYNINGAEEKLIQRLLARLSQNLLQNLFLSLDGRFRFQLPVPYASVVKGDQRLHAVAAASVLAKVMRDRLMGRLHRRWPEYALAQNKGYGTQGHREALKRWGPLSIHRHSYAPIASLLYEGAAAKQKPLLS